MNRLNGSYRQAVAQVCGCLRRRLVLDQVVLPSSLQSLSFGDLEKVTLPSGLQSLTFGNLEKVTLPSGLQSVAQSLEKVTLTSGLRLNVAYRNRVARACRAPAATTAAADAVAAATTAAADAVAAAAMTAAAAFATGDVLGCLGFLIYLQFMQFRLP